MNKKDMNIMPYDGQDAFYSGTDEEYEEFLRQASERVNFINADTEPEPVDNTQRINLNETINLQNVIDKFKKTAGDIGQGAKIFKDSVVNKMDKFMAKRPETEGETGFAGYEDSSPSFENVPEPPVRKPQQTYVKTDAGQAGTGKETELVNSALHSVSEQIDALAEQIAELESRLSANSDEKQDAANDIAEEIKNLGSGISDIRQSVGSVAKLNDSIFDLKNTQLNTKNSVANLEIAFGRLKKKCVLGVTVVSILSAIIIALEILLMLS